MTANKLADELQELDSKLHLIELFKAATMLRQQQAEIERLTMLCDCMTTESNRKGNEIEELKAHPVKDLEDIDINITWNENSMRDFGKDELNFARAILKKASEK